MRQNLFDYIKEIFFRILKSRILVLIIVMGVLCVFLVQRLFVLQIVNGSDYAENYQLKIKKERTISATRGNIYDRNGELLAYNELSYNVTIEDSGTYHAEGDKSANEIKNETLNSQLYNIIQVLDKNEDKIYNTFGIRLAKNNKFKFVEEEGTARQRFRADVFGHARIDELEYNKKLGINEATASADQIIEYLASDRKFNIVESDYESKNDFYRIVVLRYALSQYSYSKYISTNIAENVSDETVAYIKENSNELVGIDVMEDTVRKYVDSEYFSHIVGYTGKISTDEYEELSKEDDRYTLSDVVGKSGIEQIMESELQGNKGSETVYVDNLGKVLEIADVKESSAGNDVYLSIDKDLQETIYKLIEKKLSEIVYSKIINAKTSSSSDIMIPIYDVYNATIKNSIIDISHFSKSKASDVEKAVYNVFLNRQSTVVNQLEKYMLKDNAKDFKDLGDEMQDYITYIIKMLKANNILLNDEIDTTDDTFLQWKDGKISFKEYISYAISMGWVDTTEFETDKKYSDSEELYKALVSYIVNDIQGDESFARVIYEYLIYNDQVTGRQLALILYDQGILEDEDDTYRMLQTGMISPYDFFKARIKNREITPAQLALDPCSGSCVITDVDSGELLACVSYPGYDNNKLAGSVDADYYASLNSDLSLPLYNHATQQKTAPGSTFKMLMSAAGLNEGVISTSEKILDKGVYENISPSPACWIYNSSHTTHGSINVSQALRDSCNYFFYEVGYRLSTDSSGYNEKKGLETIQEYAEMFGLNEKSGVEISESEPTVATEYPITASIGQSNNSYTLTQLSRYVTAVASSGTLYKYTLLSKVTDADGNVLKEYSPKVESQIDELSDTTWDAIHKGMRMVVKEHDEFDSLKTKAAGKTGTAQEDKSRANHALFVGYAPFKNPEITITTRIAFGYSSSNAADLSSDVLAYYFGEKSAKKLLSSSGSSSASNRVGD